MTAWRERCFCGAEFEYSAGDVGKFQDMLTRAHYELSEWRIRHARSCPGVRKPDRSTVLRAQEGVIHD